MLTGTPHCLVCPPPAELAAFRLGKLPPEAVEELAGHVESCPECQARLESLEADSDGLVEALRKPLDSEPFTDEPECRFALARVLSIGDVERMFPSQVGQYQLVRRLGRGAMGSVYEALHPRLKRVVALKLLAGHHLDNSGSLARFRREMEAVGQLDHTHIIRATDAGEVDGVPFLVMEFVDGLDLARIVKACGPLTVGDACAVIRQAALGMQHAYEHGLVHRDLKPSNLLLGPAGVVKVLDLGMALFQGEHAANDELTATGQVLGTFDYMAPEQSEDTHSVDIRADVYSLGCTLYHFLAGRAPFSGTEYRTFRSKMRAHAEAPPPPITSSLTPLPSAFQKMLADMLAKDPSSRPATPAALAEALAPFAEGSDLPGLLARARLAAGIDSPQAGVDTADQRMEAPDTHSGGKSPATKTVRSRRLMVLGLVVLILAAVGGGLTAPLFNHTPSEKNAPKEPVVDEHKEEIVPVVYPVAVLTFEERGGAAKDLGARVTDVLLAKLGAKEGIFLLERNDLKKVLEELELSLSSAAKPAEATRVGQLTGAKLLLAGSIVSVDKNLHLVARLIGTETGRIVIASVEGKATDELGPMIEKLADQIADKIKDAGNLVAQPVARVDRLAALKQKLKKGVRPVVWLSVTERHVGRPATDPSAQTELIAYLKATGFEVIDAEEGNKGKADLIIKGEAFSETAGRTGNIVTVKGRVEIKVVERKTDKVLAVARQVSVVADLAEQIAGKAALQEAAATIAERLIPTLVKE